VFFIAQNYAILRTLLSNSATLIKWIPHIAIRLASPGARAALVEYMRLTSRAPVHALVRLDY
jgi:hypothetical protein